jgi:hypothetical protein
MTGLEPILLLAAASVATVLVGALAISARALWQESMRSRRAHAAVRALAAKPSESLTVGEIVAAVRGAPAGADSESLIALLRRIPNQGNGRSTPDEPGSSQATATTVRTPPATGMPRH